MLVLSRKPGEEIVIGNDIRVLVTRIAGNRVTIGVAAPEHVKIVRGELESFAPKFEDGNASSPLPISDFGFDNNSGLSDIPRTAR